MITDLLIKSVGVIGAVLFVIKPAWAEDFLDIASNDGTFPCGFYLGAGIGEMFPHVTGRETFVTSGMPDFPDDKYLTTDWSNPTLYMLMGGYQWGRGTEAEWFPGYALQLQYTYTKPQFHGLIYVNSLPDMQNYTYQYSLKQQLILLQLKVDIYNWCNLLPYVLVGAGMAYNDVNYSEAAIQGQTLMEKRDVFGPDNSSQMAYAVGAGIDYWLGDGLRAGIGYQYAYTGEVTTGSGTTVLSGARITNQLYTQSVDFHAVYFFNFF